MIDKWQHGQLGNGSNYWLLLLSYWELAYLFSGWERWLVLVSYGWLSLSVYPLFLINLWLIFLSLIHFCSMTLSKTSCLTMVRELFEQMICSCLWQWWEPKAVSHCVMVLTSGSWWDTCHGSAVETTTHEAHDCEWLMVTHNNQKGG